MKGVEAVPEAVEAAIQLTKELQEQLNRLVDQNKRRSIFAADAPDAATFKNELDDWVAREHHFRDQYDHDLDGPCIFGMGESCPQDAPANCSKCAKEEP